MENTTLSYSHTSTPAAGDSFLALCGFSHKHSMLAIQITFGVLALSTIVGNGLVLVSFLRFKLLRSNFNTLVANLAVADLMLGFVFLTVPLEEFVSKNKYFCLVKFSLVLTTLSASGFIVLFMSTERCLATVFPLKHYVWSQKQGVKVSVVLTIWVTSFGYGFGSLFGWNRYDETKVDFCTIGVVMREEINVFGSAILILLSVMNLVLCSIAIVTVSRKVKLSSVNSKRNTAKLKLLIPIYCWFAVCWMPVALVTIINYSIQLDNLSCIREWLGMLGYFNSVLNWLIYGIANDRFRTALKTMLLCRSVDNTVRRATSSGLGRSNN